MFSEDDLLPLSALQHLLFCERQCALIHVEGLWAENRLTLEGSHLHKKVDTAPGESRGDLRIARGVPLRSLRLGLIGKADAVEFHRTGADDWRPFPVEYKRGKPKRDRSDETQLCAQALCLEEMLGTPIPAGALFYGTTRRRFDIAFDAALRAATETAALRLHEMIRGGITPRAVREPKCERCSLLQLCLPEALGPGRSAARYLERAIRGLEPAALPATPSDA
ncbi:MAG: CRISPR-associated protein Cas4 [Gemmatimonadota bacterium]|nr:CRISPR-associated protein Cas4 [Gemmatimonadota bacterium]